MHRIALPVLLVALAASDGFAQGIIVAGGGGRSGFDGTFGRLVASEYLQKELGLTPKQIRRMREISIQMLGARALYSAEVQKELRLSKKQIAEIARIEKAAKMPFMQPFRPGKDGKPPKINFAPGDFMKRREKEMQDLGKVLTETQQKKLEKMKGKPVDRAKLFGVPRPPRDL